MEVKEIKRTVYETVDGQQFDTEKEAREYETNLVINNFSEKEIAFMLKHKCEERQGCVGCPFFQGYVYCALNSTLDSWTI